MERSGNKDAAAWGRGQRVGVLGGTFDPVHNGHLALAAAAREEFALDLVAFIPAAQPPHKLQEPVSSFHHRAAMLELALAGEAAFVLNRMEEHRPGPSYSIDTLRQLRQTLPPGCRLFFIIGADAFREIATWKNHRELFRYAEFLVAARPGSGLPGLADFMAAQDGFSQVEAGRVWQHRQGGRVHRLPLAGVDISASEIRRRARNGQALAGLAPEPVIHYIRTHALYQAPVGN